ncbi:MAG: sulfotransferase, partial [Cyanobacteriota bacterium]
FRRLMDAVSMVGVQTEDGHDWLVESYQDDLELPCETFADLDVRVVFLVRDLRSWVHSRMRDRRNQGKPLLGSRNVARWCRVNHRFDRALQRCGKPVFQLGYEELALAPERALGRLCDWLGLAFAPAMLTPGLASGSHILSGNRVRFDPEKIRQIRYDASWLTAPAWPASAALNLQPLARMNRRLVYSNQLIDR